MDYNDVIWNNYMKRFSNDFLVIEFSRCGGFVIPCKRGMVIPYSIDRRALLFVSFGEWSALELTSLIRSLPDDCVVVSLGCDNIAVVIPEFVFSKSLAKKLGYRPNLNKRGFIKAFIKDGF